MNALSPISRHSLLTTLKSSSALTPAPSSPQASAHLVIGPGPYADYATLYDLAQATEEAALNKAANRAIGEPATWDDYATELGEETPALWIYLNWSNVSTGSATLFFGWTLCGNIEIRSVPGGSPWFGNPVTPGQRTAYHVYNSSSGATLTIGHLGGNVAFRGLYMKDIGLYTGPTSNTLKVIHDRCLRYNTFQYAPKLLYRAATNHQRVEVIGSAFFRKQGDSHNGYELQGAVDNDPDFVIEGSDSWGDLIYTGRNFGQIYRGTLRNVRAAGSRSTWNTVAACDMENVATDDASGDIPSNALADMFVDVDIYNFDVRPAAAMIGAGDDTIYTLNGESDAVDMVGITRANDAVGSFDNNHTTVDSIGDIAATKAAPISVNTPAWVVPDHLASGIEGYNLGLDIFYGGWHGAGMVRSGAKRGNWLYIGGGHASYPGSDVGLYSATTLKFSINTNQTPVDYQPVDSGSNIDHRNVFTGGWGHQYGQLPIDETSGLVAGLGSDGPSNSINVLSNRFYYDFDGNIEPTSGESSGQPLGTVHPRSFTARHPTERYSLVWASGSSFAHLWKLDYTETIASGNRETLLSGTYNPQIGNATLGLAVIRTPPSGPDEYIKFEPTSPLVIVDSSPYTETKPTPDSTYGDISSNDLSLGAPYYHVATDKIHLFGSNDVRLIDPDDDFSQVTIPMNGDAGGYSPLLICEEMKTTNGGYRYVDYLDTEDLFVVTNTGARPLVATPRLPTGLAENMFHADIEAGFSG